jgi:hypothetical protein
LEGCLAFRFKLANLPAVVSHPLSNHHAIPRSEDGVSDETRAHFGASEFSRRKTDVEAFCSLAQATGRRIHAGVRVVHFFLCGLPALGRAFLIK